MLDASDVGSGGMNSEIEAVLAGESEGCIVQGDCLEVMAGMPDGCCVVITDPPYGIGFDYDTHDDSEALWYPLMDAAVPQIRRVSTLTIMPCCAIKRLGWWYANHAPDWLIAWYKGSPGHRSAIGFNDWEAHLVWGRPYKQMHDYFQTRCGFSITGHPCPKPVEYAEWLVQRACGPEQVVLDPFCGSGTTCVAAKKLGRRHIGIELDEKYCQIARNRVRDTERPLF
jgi:DNA modification methylase